MLEVLKRLFASAAPPNDFLDPALGQLRWSEDEGAWLAPVPSQPTVRFQITGDRTPDPRLLVHAQDIAANFPAFQEMVRATLEAEAATFNPFYTEEIKGLRLESIHLFWPKRPDDGMLYLAGGRNDRLWRFDYVHRRPAGLGFDS